MKSPASYSLPMTIFREGAYFVAYSPALDLSSAGKTTKEAKRMFAEAVDVYFEELVEMGTLNAVLKDLGWTKTKNILQPPKVVQHRIVDIHVPAMA